MLSHHPGLMCGLVSIEVTEDAVTFYLPENHCTDMAGAIALATAVNPSVTQIKTMAGTHPDTEYAKVRGNWECPYVPDPRRAA